MAYDDKLADRVRAVLGRRRGITEKKMFGGLAFLLHGNMCCGVVKDDLCLRLGEEGSTRALTREHARPMDFTGKPLKTMIYVGPQGVRTRPSLEQWVEQAIEFTSGLPRKPGS